jgi:hypothetical protein
MAPYIAFISYRQADPDRTIAAKLHQWLETYTTPRGLVGTGVRRSVGRIFFDREEMQSGPLHAALKQALAEAQYLIVICSPRTRDSAWMASEIRTFLETHSADRILPVLLEGVPEAAYPEPLLEISRREMPGPGGTTSVYYEPLAADVRADSTRLALRKLRAEKLRLLAPILGTTFAALRQREKERTRKRAWGLTAASCALLLLLAAVIILTNTRRVWHPTSLPAPIGGPGLAFNYKLAGHRMIWSRELGFVIYNVRTLAIERLVRGGKYVYPSPGGRYLFTQPSYVPGQPPPPQAVQAVEWKSGAAFRLDVPNEGGVIDAWSGANEDYVSWVEEIGNELRVRIRSVRENRDVASLAGLVDAPYVRNYRYFAMAEAPQQAILYPGTVTATGDRYLMTGARNKRFVPLLWNIQAGQLPQTLLVDPASPGAAWAYNRERDTIAVLEGANATQLRLSLWRPRDGALLRQRVVPAIPAGDSTAMLSFTQNGKTLLAPGPNGVHVLDAETLEGTFLVAARPAAAMENPAFAIELWLHPHPRGAVLENVALGKRYVLPSFQLDPTIFVIVNQAGTRMVAFRRDTAPELWNLDSGGRTILPITPTGPVSFSFDERWITATKDGVAYLFRTDTGEAAGTLANVERAAPPLVTDPGCGALVAWFDNGRIIRYEPAYEIFDRVTIPLTRTRCDLPPAPSKAAVTTLAWER